MTELYPERSKGEAIVAKCIKNDEPFFVFRARDIFSPMVIRYYLKLLEDMGPTDPDMQADIVDFLGSLRIWQTNHVGEVRYPD